MAAIGVILLAAGGSSRLGRPKQLLPWGTTTLLHRAAMTAVETGLAPVIVVLGAESERCRREVESLPVKIAVNESWSEGMGSSLRVGVEALEKALPEADGALVMLNDQPRIAAATLQRLVELWQWSRKAAAAGFYGDRVGVPAVFGRALFAELKALPGAEGARGILERYADQLAKMEMPEALDDIDSAEDYRRVLAEVSR
jgi:molybdenum cofactor cytidylyltransferase